MVLDQKTVKALAHSLKFREMNQDLISSNLANQDTPGHKAKRLEFEESLARALDVDDLNQMKVTSEKHFSVGGGGFSNLSPQIVEDSTGPVTLDGNTVDRDREMALMAENRILYEANVNLLNKKLSLMKYILQQEQ